MRKISIDEIKPGMYLTHPLIAADGTILLHAGLEIKERYIKYLRNQGFTALFVGELQYEEVPGTEDYYSEKRSADALNAALEKIAGFRAAGKGVKLDKVKSIARSLLDRFSQSPENMHRFLDIRRKEEYIFTHSVNTCFLSVMTGLALGYDSEQLNELALAAMLHDIGKLKFSRHLASQFPRYLTLAEKEEYKQHTYYALEILRENKNISVNIINACFQHHERWNGRGYPMGIKGDSISEYAQIIGIADVYDRLITGLPHRAPTPVYYASAILNMAAGEYFNPALVEKFNQSIVTYPMGKTVRLNNGQSGVILGVGLKNKNTPTIRISSNYDGTPANQLVELDLSKNPEFFIIDFEEISPQAYSYAEQSRILHSPGETYRSGS